jgi:hypothetical protein
MHAYNQLTFPQKILQENDDSSAEPRSSSMQAQNVSVVRPLHKSSAVGRPTRVESLWKRVGGFHVKQLNERYR